MLGRALSPKRWVALVLLTLGVAVVQLPAGGADSNISLKDADNKFYFPRSFHEIGQLSTGAVEVARELTKRGIEGFAEGLSKRSATYEGIEEDLGISKPPILNYSIGLTAVLCAALISGLTGVYFEKVLKESTQHVTVWTRNVQLSFYSLFPALIVGVVFKDGHEIAKNGFFDGYNAVVVCCTYDNDIVNFQNADKIHSGRRFCSKLPVEFWWLCALIMQITLLRTSRRASALSLAFYLVYGFLTLKLP